jgi:hypothetical protein
MRPYIVAVAYLLALTAVAVAATPDGCAYIAGVPAYPPSRKFQVKFVFTIDSRSGCMPSGALLISKNGSDCPANADKRYRF